MSWSQSAPPDDPHPFRARHIVLHGHFRPKPSAVNLTEWKRVGSHNCGSGKASAPNRRCYREIRWCAAKHEVRTLLPHYISKTHLSRCSSKIDSWQTHHGQWLARPHQQGAFPMNHNLQRHSPQGFEPTQGSRSRIENYIPQRQVVQWLSRKRVCGCAPRHRKNETRTHQFFLRPRTWRLFPVLCSGKRQTFQWPWRIQGWCWCSSNCHTLRKYALKW